MASPDPAAHGPHSSSVLHALRGYFGTWLDVFRTRFELFTTELEEEQERLQQIVILGAAALLCLGFGIVLATFFVLALFWDTEYRLLVLGGLALLYLAAGIAVAIVTRRKSRARPKLFAGTLDELAKDYRHLSS